MNKGFDLYHNKIILATILDNYTFHSGIEIISTKDFFRFSDFNEMIKNLSALMSGAIIAFCLECSEYLVITYTSSLTLSIAGIMKVF